MTGARGGLLRGLAALILAAALAGCGSEAGAPATPATGGGRKILYYRSSMDPSFISTQPGKDSMGMDLVPVRDGDPGADLKAISLKGALVQQMGVRVAPVRSARLTRLVRAVGRVEVDERRIETVNMKFDGWIEKLWVNETGQQVRRGAPLFAVYSPELQASAQQYADVLKAGGPGELLSRAARQRLLQFDVPRSYVDGVAATKQAHRQVVIAAPASGFVIHKTAFEGTFVKKGANLFTIADLKGLWVIADVFEQDASWILPGQHATVELDYLPGRLEEAKVDYVYPTLDRKSRTVQVRLVLPNPKVLLKPGMFATVRIHTQPAGETLVVPSEAVLHGGERKLVFVAQGAGRFAAREVKLGVSGEGTYQVLDGLKLGEQVVVSGQFLFDSEANLKEAVLKLLGSNVTPAAPAPGDGGMTMPMLAAGDGGMSMPAAAQPPGDGGMAMPMPATGARPPHGADHSRRR